jgi:hypothetical protein
MADAGAAVHGLGARTAIRLKDYQQRRSEQQSGRCYENIP